MCQRKRMMIGLIVVSVNIPMVKDITFGWVQKVRYGPGKEGGYKMSQLVKALFRPRRIR